VAVTVLERARERAAFTCGMGVHARTLEVLAMRSMADIPLARGRRVPLAVRADHGGLTPGTFHCPVTVTIGSATGRFT